MTQEIIDIVKQVTPWLPVKATDDPMVVTVMQGFFFAESKEPLQEIITRVMAELRKEEAWKDSPLCKIKDPKEPTTLWTKLFYTPLADTAGVPCVFTTAKALWENVLFQEKRTTYVLYATPENWERVFSAARERMRKLFPGQFLYTRYSVHLFLPAIQVLGHISELYKSMRAHRILGRPSIFSFGKSVSSFYAMETEASMPRNELTDEMLQELYPQEIAFYRERELHFRNVIRKKYIRDLYQRFSEEMVYMRKAEKCSFLEAAKCLSDLLFAVELGMFPKERKQQIVSTIQLLLSPGEVFAEMLPDQMRLDKIREIIQ